jgi:protease-4
MAAKKEQDKPKKHTGWIILIVVLVIFGLFSLMLAGLFSMAILFSGDRQTRVGSGNVAVISINQPIYTERMVSGFSTVGVSSSDIVNMIEEADSDPSIDAILLEINSPGGSAVASEEVVNAVKKTRKITVSWIREVGASGAYWIASASDHIVASRMSVVGSIGVISSYIEFSGLMERYNVTYQRLVSGKYKDMGTPFKELTNEEREMFMQELEDIHDIFMYDVAANRGIPENDIEELSEGQIFLGANAIEHNLIDQLGSKDEVIQYLQDTLETDQVALVEFRRQVGFWEIFSMSMQDNSFSIGRGIGSSLKENERHGAIIT